jgi:hypothetical protein
MNLPSRHGLNPKCRRSGHLTDIAVACTAPYSFHPGTDLEPCNRVPNWTSLKTGLEKEIAVTQFGEMPDFEQLKEGPSVVIPTPQTEIGPTSVC